MANTPYAFVLSDFPGGVLEYPDRLAVEIRASSITVAFDHIDTAGSDVLIWFKATLSAPEEATLDAVVAAHVDTPVSGPPTEVTVANGPRTREDGVLYAIPKPSSFGLVMCDRDMRVNTCMVTTASSVEDWKINTQTNKEVDWNELVLVGVYKDVSGTMTLCDDQADADVNGILSAWDYTARAGGVQILYELRDGMLYVDKRLPAGEEWAHRAYAVVAPAIPAAYGGSIAVFDGYLAENPDNMIAALSPQSTVLDPAVPPGGAGSVVRLYIVHPAGSKLSHVLRLVTYRAPGTF